MVFSQISFVADDLECALVEGVIPKVSTSIELDILKLLSKNLPLVTFFQRSSSNIVYYTRKLRYFVQFFDFVPRITDSKGRVVEPTELKQIYLSAPAQKDVIIALLNSNLFFWFFNAYSDVRNINRREIEDFRCSINLMDAHLVRECSLLTKSLMEDFNFNSKYLTNNYGKFGVLTIQTFQPRLSKPIIDQIDRALAKHYGFTDEELDFIINYDIKYRMGQDNSEVDEE